MLDRVDLRVWVGGNQLSGGADTADSLTMRRRILAARAFGRSRGAAERPKKPGKSDNSPRHHSDETVADATKEARRNLAVASERLGLSARATDSVLRVARTIADLEQSAAVCADHILEAVYFRRRGEDRPLWWAP